MSLADDVIDAAPGTIDETAAINLPPGYLWANGSAVSRTGYARLFAAISVSISGVIVSGNASITGISQDLTQLPTSLVGSPVSGPGIPAGAIVTSISATAISISAAPTASASGAAIVIAPHGVGDGITTFNVPDRRGRAGVGHDVMGAAAARRMTTAGSGVNGALLGASGGEETHSLATTELPSHSHANTVSNPAHTHGNVFNDAAHSHGGTFQAGNTTEGSSGTGGAGIFFVAANQGIPAAVTGASITNAAATPNVVITNVAAGGGGVHNNAQPSIIMNYIVKT